MSKILVQYSLAEVEEALEGTVYTPLTLTRKGMSQARSVIKSFGIKSSDFYSRSNSPCFVIKLEYLYYYVVPSTFNYGLNISPVTSLIYGLIPANGFFQSASLSLIGVLPLEGLGDYFDQAALRFDAAYSDTFQGISQTQYHLDHLALVK